MTSDKPRFSTVTCDLLAQCRENGHLQKGESSECGSQHPSPNVKIFCKFEPQFWLEFITSRDAKSACFKGSRTSCRELIFGTFWPNFGQKRSHHVMDGQWIWTATFRFSESSGSLNGPDLFTELPFL